MSKSENVHFIRKLIRVPSYEPWGVDHANKIDSWGYYERIWVECGCEILVFTIKNVVYKKNMSISLSYKIIIHFLTQITYT